MRNICLFFILSVAISLTACEKEIVPDFSDKILTEEPVENGLYAYRCPHTGALSDIVDGIGEEGELIMTETSIKANVPVILFSGAQVIENLTGFSETPATETLTGVSLAEAETYTAGLLTGVYAPVEITSGYVLQNLGSKIKFYRVSEDNAITIPANKAYLTIED